MSVAEKFGSIIEKTSDTNPGRASKILKLGWQAMNVKNRFAPDKRLSASDAYLAKMLMDMMIAPLKYPDRSAIVSIFTPCELLHAFGLNPYNAEAYSCFIAASECGGTFLRQTESEGIPETLCSYQRIFIGAAGKNILPRPKCIVSTNLACDANQLTFRHMAAHFNVPHFIIDVPYTPSESAVIYVAGQLRELYTFLEKCTGRHPSQEKVREIIRRSRTTIDLYETYLSLRKDKLILTDLVSPLYEFAAVNILRGTPQTEKYVRMALETVNNAPPAEGTRIFWMHTIPYWMKSVKKLLNFSPEAQIVGCDMVTSALHDFDPEDPYTAMARCMVYNPLNGDQSRRIETGLKYAKEADSDGAVWFCHWGCKRTMAAANAAKRRFEEENIPMLVLNGDGVDRTGGGDEQTGTRLEAFLEMLKK